MIQANRCYFSVDGTKQTPIEAKLAKDGKPLPLKEVEVVVSDDKVTYTIKKPARNLSGKYQIRISNGQGEAVKDININMQGKIMNLYFQFLFLLNIVLNSSEGMLFL